MKNFQRTLEDCLAKLSNGTATMDECLACYPEYAEELKPLLQTVLLLNRGRDVVPSPTFNAYTRSAVIQYIRSRPRQPRAIVMPMFQRTALTFAMLVLALLITGTAKAQSAMPGDTFYTWKRVSEKAWRAVSLDPVATDIVFAERRLNEWLAVVNDPVQSDAAMNNYLEAVSNLEAANDVESVTRIVPVLQAQQKALNNAGLPTTHIDNYLVEAVSSIPAVVPTQVPPTSTHVAPTATDIPPTAVPPTDVPPTATEVPPTATEVPPTATAVPPTATEVPPTATAVPPTATEVPPTDVPTEIAPTDVPTQEPESTPVDEPAP